MTMPETAHEMLLRRLTARANAGGDTIFARKLTAKDDETLKRALGTAMDWYNDLADAEGRMSTRGWRAHQMANRCHKLLIKLYGTLSPPGRLYKKTEGLKAVELVMTLDSKPPAKR